MRLAEAAETYDVQPYYAAYMLAHDYTGIQKGKNLEFMFWIQGMWRESGLRIPTDRDLFHPWLEERVTTKGPVL